MTKLFSAILGCILASAAVKPASAETSLDQWYEFNIRVKSLLVTRLQEKFDFQYNGKDFVGKIHDAQDDLKTETCKSAGWVVSKVWKKGQESGKFRPKPYVATIYVCLNEQGVLELRPLAVVYDALVTHPTGVVMSESFWKTCGIKGRGPSDAERTKLGNIITASLNAFLQS